MLKQIKKFFSIAYSNLDKFCGRLANFLFKLLFAMVLDTILFCSTLYGYWYYFTPEGLAYRVQQLYREIIIQTGQSQDALPLYVVDSPEDNAYNNGRKIVIYTGLINHASSWDEIALVLGHEVAHGNLWHLKMPLDKLKDEDIQVLEANADKMGAIYMMKAGYNVCKGRMLFKYWEHENGDSLGGNHPNYAYRFDQLNINCD